MAENGKYPFWRKPKFIIGAALTVLFIVVLLQNWDPVILHFLVWYTPEVPLFVVMIASFAVGALVSGLIVYLRLRRK